MITLTKSTEMERAQSWLAEHFWRPGAGNGDWTSFPVTFQYDGRQSGALLAEWKTQRGPAHVEDGFTRETIIVSDPRTGLECRRVWRSLGRQLMADGFGVTIADQPGSAVITYKRVS